MELITVFEIQTLLSACQRYSWQQFTQTAGRQLMDGSHRAPVGIHLIRLRKAVTCFSQMQFIYGIRLTFVLYSYVVRGYVNCIRLFIESSYDHKIRVYMYCILYCKIFCFLL